MSDVMLNQFIQHHTAGPIRSPGPAGQKQVYHTNKQGGSWGTHPAAVPLDEVSHSRLLLGILPLQHGECEIAASQGTCTAPPGGEEAHTCYASRSLHQQASANQCKRSTSKLRQEPQSPPASTMTCSAKEHGQLDELQEPACSLNPPASTVDGCRETTASSPLPGATDPLRCRASGSSCSACMGTQGRADMQVWRVSTYTLTSVPYYAAWMHGQRGCHKINVPPLRKIQAGRGARLGRCSNTSTAEESTAKPFSPVPSSELPLTLRL